MTSITEFRAPEMTKIREKFFGPHRPASTLVQIQQLANPAYKIEIEAIAARRSAGAARRAIAYPCPP